MERCGKLWKEFFNKKDIKVRALDKFVEASFGENV